LPRKKTQGGAQIAQPAPTFFLREYRYEPLQLFIAKKNAKIFLRFKKFFSFEKIPKIL